ncbi:hypothetical protein F7725_028441 [Dissostichus mawsoni]|uniref:TLC domain-containing protein n=1 Tax=Dissostichus mawsoni TaxID=36200 RepID=A0A7J5XGD0_DISMA|nr:hypothetical protein F7725_028441 [Dissostichus mawsoni]
MHTGEPLITQTRLNRKQLRGEGEKEEEEEETPSPVDMGIRKKTTKTPPVLSHEFVIQNHADIVSCVAMVFLLGLMFEVTSKFAVLFITVQYNVTISTSKINRKKHFSKTKHSKFNESGQLSAFYLFSSGWGASILMSENLLSNPVSLWEGYPHTLMPFQMKFYFICQLGYWLHALPELYFQKTKKVLNRLALVLLVLHYVVELLFHMSRLNQGFDLSAGNFNVIFVRITVLAAICLTQAFMMWKFINFQLRRWREHGLTQNLKKKQVPAKSKSKKDKANGGKRSELQRSGFTESEEGEVVINSFIHPPANPPQCISSAPLFQASPLCCAISYENKFEIKKKNAYLRSAY